MSTTNISTRKKRCIMVVYPMLTRTKQLGAFFSLRLPGSICIFPLVAGEDLPAVVSSLLFTVHTVHVEVGVAFIQKRDS